MSDEPTGRGEMPSPTPPATSGVDRRQLFKLGAAAAAVVAAAAVYELTPAATPPSPPAKGGEKKGDQRKKRKWGMVIDLQRCVGCRACTAACKQENKTPPGVSYTVVFEEEIGEFPNVRKQWVPRPCMHCENSSCTRVCPVKATYAREDGIVIVDYDKCIGCRYCIAACPYGARYFDFGENYPQQVTAFGEIASPEYKRNAVRQAGRPPIGNVRKCTFCLHKQDENGNYREPPACVQTCMGRAIHFGDLNDPESEVNYLLATRRSMRLKEELGNEPNVYYLV